MVPKNSFESAREQTGKEVQSMLGRLEKRVNAGGILADHKNSVENAVGLAAKALVAAKEMFDRNSNIDSVSVENLAKFTNAWYAWGDWGKNNFFKGYKFEPLQKSLKPMLEKSDIAAKYARQIWRTEMVSFLMANLQKSKRADKADVMLALMGGQEVKKTEDEPHEALNAAGALDPKLRNKRHREEVVRKMEDANKERSKPATAEFFKKNNFDVKEIKVVVGGSLFTVPPELAQKFEYKNLVWSLANNRIYAQMENGCKGNLVIIELNKPKMVQKTQTAEPLLKGAAAPTAVSGLGLNGVKQNDILEVKDDLVIGRLSEAEKNAEQLLYNIGRYPVVGVGTLNVARGALTNELKAIKGKLTTPETHRRFDALEKSLLDANTKLRALPLTDSDRLFLEGFGPDNIQKLAKNGIKVSWDKVNKRPFVDTGKVYRYAVVGETFTKQPTVNSLPLDKYMVKGVACESDGVTVFQMIDKASSAEIKLIFSKTKEMPVDPKYFDLYE